MGIILLQLGGVASLCQIFVWKDKDRCSKTGVTLAEAEYKKTEVTAVFDRLIYLVILDAR